MIVRSELSPDRALELNRKFQAYLHAFGDAQSMARSIPEELVKDVMAKHFRVWMFFAAILV